jgi:hypothetical protein
MNHSTTCDQNNGVVTSDKEETHYASSEASNCFEEFNTVSPFPKMQEFHHDSITTETGGDALFCYCH